MTAALLLLGLGLVLVVAEVLFPSFGVLSVLATASIVGAIVLAFRESTDTGVRFLFATAFLVPVMIVVGLRFFPKSPIGKRMIARGLTFGGSASTDPRDLDLRDAEGVVEASCRPAGIARFEGRRVDVVSRGEWIERGEHVRVLEVRGNRILVARVTEGEDSAPAESGAPQTEKGT